MTMAANLMRSFFLVGLWLLGSTGAHAEGGCPPGMYPFQFAPNQPSSCAPIPGAGNQQAPQQPAQLWESRWGAVAIDVPRAAVGASTNQRSKREASQAAVSECQRRGGVNCEIEAAYDNQCVAVVAGDGTHNTSNAITVDKAIEWGMKTCRDGGFADCHIFYSACSLPVQIR